MKQWLLYIFLSLFALIVLVTTVGVAYEMFSRRQAALAFPPPGKLVDIGGRRVQLDCRGTGDSTVVFESGLDIMGSLSWSAVHDAIAKTTRACAYSRAGIMWSDARDTPSSAKSIAEDLHAALSKAGERGPFVLVGHSLGGPYIMTYTKYFGAEVAGLVFVDASHPEQIERSEAVVKIPDSKLMQLRNKLGALLNWTGVVRVVANTYEKMPNVPDSVDQAVKAYAATSLGAMLKEDEIEAQTFAEAGTFRQLGDRPLFVLTATAPTPEQIRIDFNVTVEQDKQLKEMWKQLHEDQATWSSQSQHQLVTDAHHYIQFDRPDIVIAAVRSVVAQVRANRNK